MKSNTMCTTIAGLLRLFCYRRNYFLLVVLLLASMESEGQNVQQLTSLVRISPEKMHDSIYYELFKLARLTNMTDAKSYASKSLDLSKKYGHYHIQAKAYRALGAAQENLNQFDSSRLLYHQGIRLALNHQFNDVTARLYNDLGYLFQKSDVYDSALHYLVLALETATQEGEFKLEATISCNIGLVYSYLENYDEALKFYKAAVEVKQAHKLDDDLNLNLLDIASILNEKHRYKEAHEEIEKVMNRCSSGCDNETLTLLSYGMAFGHFCQGELENAKNDFEHALSLAQGAGNEKIIADSEYFLSLIYSKNNASEKAVAMLLDAQRHASTINHKRSLKNIFLELSQCYSRIGNRDLAAKYQGMYFELHDEIFNRGVANNLTKIQLTDQRKKSDIVIKQKDWAIWRANEISFILTINVLLSVVLIFLIYKALRASWRNKKQMALNMSAMLGEHEVKQRELFRVKLEKDELTIRMVELRNACFQVEVADASGLCA